MVDFKCHHATKQDHKSEEPQLRNCLQQVGLQECSWRTLIILIDLERPGHLVGGTFQQQPRFKKNTGEGRYLVSPHSAVPVSATNSFADTRTRFSGLPVQTEEWWFFRIYFRLGQLRYQALWTEQLLAFQFPDCWVVSLYGSYTWPDSFLISHQSKNGILSSKHLAYLENRGLWVCKDSNWLLQGLSPTKEG